MIEDFIKIVGKDNILTDQTSIHNYAKDWLKNFTPSATCILLPTSTFQIQQILKYCNQHHIAVVPSGGRTGLSGGAVAINNEVVLSLEKLNKEISVNLIDRTITCSAGVTTQKIQEVANQNNLFFPIDFASKGSSQIGGNIATNAGGIRVLKYGNIRDWVLGLEVVLADGQVLELNGSLFKNNSGYDFRNLVIGSEGTLAIVTKVILKLTTPPSDLVRCLFGLSSLKNVTELLRQVRNDFPSLSMFEYFPRAGLDLVLQHNKLKDPLDQRCEHYVLIELENISTELIDQTQDVLLTYIEHGLIESVVVSQNSKQLEELLNYRELLPETLNSNFKLYKNDISVPVSEIPEFIEQYEKLITASYADLLPITFGHIGDGNLHLNILKPAALNDKDFAIRIEQVNPKLFELISKYHGSISAEHGVGLIKKPYLHFTKSPVEIELMQKIKNIFDPNGILNPGKIFGSPTLVGK